MQFYPNYILKDSLKCSKPRDFIHMACGNFHQANYPEEFIDCFKITADYIKIVLNGIMDAFPMNRVPGFVKLMESNRKGDGRETNQ